MRILLLLAVHLKAGCRQGALESPFNPGCAILAAPGVPMEAWIDAAAAGTAPFGVLGDFNRAFDRFGQDDHVWREIDDSDPAGLDLRRLPFRQASDGWRGTSRHHSRPIDVLVFDDRAWQLVDQASFRPVTYEAADQDGFGVRPWTTAPSPSACSWSEAPEIGEAAKGWHEWAAEQGYGSRPTWWTITHASPWETRWGC